METIAILGNGLVIRESVQTLLSMKWNNQLGTEYSLNSRLEIQLYFKQSRSRNCLHIGMDNIQTHGDGQVINESDQTLLNTRTMNQRDIEETFL